MSQTACCDQGKEADLDAGPMQSLVELLGIVQRGTGVFGAMQQQHWWHQVSILGAVNNVCG